MKRSLVNKKKKGFTLIELIIVLAVMAIIAAIAVPSYNAIKNQSAIKADEQSCETIERVALMLKTQGDLDDDTYTITATPVENKKGEFTVAVTSAKEGTKVTKLQEALSEVREPQQEGVDHYELVVSGKSIDCNTKKTTPKQ